MIKITLKIEGMSCPRCEAHVAKAISSAFPVDKVTASHTKKQAVIIAENDIADTALREVIKNAGFEPVGVHREQYKKGLFSFLGK
ncbi:MAG: heavy-metal-associated domain-containing protein [Oscillospiraceae bacterium]|nr:heavy-metal-associated domain-containing protein [Oscillospiraceae bacterium]